MSVIRALHALGATNRGGIETWLVRILPHLDRKRIQIDLLVHDPNPGAYHQVLRDLGVGIHPCPQPHRPWTYAPRLRRILAEQGPYQIFHGQQFLFNGALLRWAAKAAIPIRIAHQHPLTDIRSGSPGRWAYRQLMGHWIARYATCLMFPSQASQDAYLATCPAPGVPVHLMPNCIDLERFSKPVDPYGVRHQLGLPLDRPLVAYVARFATHKNHLLTFAVADRMRSLGHRIHVVLAGSHGEQLEEVKRRAALRDDVTVLTGLEDVTALLRASDAFLFPSLEEGFGVVAIEAEAAGLPVIATAMPSIAEALCPEQRELQFPANDSEQAANSLAKVLTDSALRRRLVQAGHTWAERFSIPAAATALSNCYEELCRDARVGI